MITCKVRQWHASTCVNQAVVCRHVQVCTHRQGSRAGAAILGSAAMQLSDPIMHSEHGSPALRDDSATGRVVG